jgi:hypothetical protein
MGSTYIDISHPQVVTIMEKYLKRMKSDVVDPALKELRDLTAKNKGDKELGAQVEFVEGRIENRIRRIAGRLKRTQAT